MITAMQKKSYRIDELASECGVSRATIYRAIKRGEILTFTVGAARRIRAEEVERLKKTESAVKRG